MTPDSRKGRPGSGPTTILAERHDTAGEPREATAPSVSPEDLDGALSSDVPGDGDTLTLRDAVDETSAVAEVLARVQSYHYDRAREWLTAAERAIQRAASRGVETYDALVDLADPLNASAAAQIAQVHIALGDRAGRHSA